MSTPTTPSGKALPHRACCVTDEEIVAIEREALLAGLDSPEMLELLAEASVNLPPEFFDRAMSMHGGPRDGSRIEFAEHLVASMRSSLRAETPE